MTYLPDARANSGASACCRLALILIATVADATPETASGQSCFAPTVLTPGFYYQVDTCQSSFSPQQLCGELFPTGPTVVFTFYVAGYSASGYTLTVSPSVGFDPALIIQTPECGESANCPFAIDSGGPGMAETFDLGILERSGQYFALVTSTNPDASCGTAQMEITYGGAGDTGDGIFRSGFNY